MLTTVLDFLVFPGIHTDCALLAVSKLCSTPYLRSTRCSACLRTSFVRPWAVACVPCLLGPPFQGGPREGKREEVKSGNLTQNVTGWLSWKTLARDIGNNDDTEDDEEET